MSTYRVVILGGGVAAVEALLALHDQAGGLVDVTVVSPDPGFRLRALSTASPFTHESPREYGMAAICAEHGARFVQLTAERVDPEAKEVELSDGRVLSYDALLVATGARQVPAHGEGVVFRGPGDAEAMEGLVRDVEAGATRSIAFVVPPGTTWPLPLYELALQLAEHARERELGDVRLTVVTPEAAPLAVLGDEASAVVAGVLAEAGIDLRAGCEAATVAGGQVADAAGRTLVEADRVVSLPRLAGTAPPGVPHDIDRFVPVDPHGRVHRCHDVWAAGDGTTFPIKQGGIAAQQAGAAASEIARAAGARVSLRAFRPVLRVQLLAGSRSEWLRHAVAGLGGAQGAAVSEDALWWPPSKVAAPYLAAYLHEVEYRAEPAKPWARRPRHPVTLQDADRRGV